jgi:hypothetical protein
MLVQFTFFEMYENLNIPVTFNMSAFICVVKENTEETTNECIWG